MGTHSQFGSFNRSFKRLLHTTLWFCLTVIRPPHRPMSNNSATHFNLLHGWHSAHPEYTAATHTLALDLASDSHLAAMTHWSWTTTRLQHPIKHELILSDNTVNPPHLPGNHEINPAALSNGITAIISTALLTEQWAED